MVTNKINDLELSVEIDGYARISYDIEKEEDENTSIENQVRIIEDYVKTKFPKCKLTIFRDRDRSGYTFEQRENYMSMRKRLMGGVSKILIVKDFSRFARRNSLGLYELELLRDAGVRIISITDAIDYPTYDDWLAIQFKFLMNEQPVTETSKKVKYVISKRQESGEWLCAVPYGYVVTDYKAYDIKVVPDEADIVREVFRLYNEGWGYKKIANHLTDKGIPTPRMKEQERKLAEGKEYKRQVRKEWSIITVSGILSNDFYTGVLRQHKYTRTKINGSDRKLGKDENFVFHNHHEPIVDDRTFAYTQEQLKQRTTSHYRGVRKHNTDYSSYLYCGDCGQPMFSMSRADLSPAYICGTYHKRGLKGCTSHHTRVDFLDSVLKDYIRLVKQNCSGMIEELEKAVASEVTAVKEHENTIEALYKLLDEAKAELKATQTMKVKAVMKAPQDEDIIAETYAEMEQSLIAKIKGLESRIEANYDKRNQIIKVNKVSKTVFQVFDNILSKEHLDKVDIALIVDRILVYDNDIVEVKLKADIEQLLQSGTVPSEDDYSNFNFDSIGISYNAKYAQKVRNQRAKAYTVNIVSEGDPLEIYTESDGTVIFKKYSPIGELGEFANQYAEALAHTAGIPACISDKDTVIAVSGVSKKELMNKKISDDIEKVMSEKSTYVLKNGAKNISVSDGNDTFMAGIAAPIIYDGDAIGTVMFLSSPEKDNFGELEQKLAESAATFLGKTIE